MAATMLALASEQIALPVVAHEKSELRALEGRVIAVGIPGGSAMSNFGKRFCAGSIRFFVIGKSNS